MELEKLFDHGILPDPNTLRTVRIDFGRATPSYGRIGNLAEHLEMLAKEFSGRKLIEYYHAGLIVHIRRRIDPAANVDRFMKLWSREKSLLTACLNSRWLVSACDTFATHASDPAERAMALTGTVLANTLKFHETERRATSSYSTEYLPVGGRDQLHDGMTAYDITDGDMANNLVKTIFLPYPTQMITPAIVHELLRRAHRHDTVWRRFQRSHRPRGRWVVPGQWKAVVINDTAIGGHYGCNAVMHMIEELLQSASVSIIHRQSVGSDWQNDRAALAAIGEADLVVVNGEGSIHHSSERARQLAAVAPYCKKLGKLGYLINATLQGNNAAILRDIAVFDRVWVRDERSQNELEAMTGIRACVCPDLSLLADLGCGSQSKDGLIVVDSVRRDQLETLRAIAVSARAPLVTMKAKDGRCMGAGWPTLLELPIDDVFNHPYSPCTGYRDFAALLGRHEQIVTGRFHAMCFAIKLRLPFHALPSNTFKIEQTVSEIGLNPDRLLKPGVICPAPLPFDAEELAAIRRYVAFAEQQAQMLVDTLREDLFEVSSRLL